MLMEAWEEPERGSKPGQEIRAAFQNNLKGRPDAQTKAAEQPAVLTEMGSRVLPVWLQGVSSLAKKFLQPSQASSL